MLEPLQDVIAGYDPHTKLPEASTIPSSWYIDPRVLALEHQTTFSRSWLCVGRLSQVAVSGQYLSSEMPSGDPVAVVRGQDGVLRGFFNVCRHHAAAVVTEPEGTAQVLRCPYHGWTYGLDGALKGTPDFAEVCHFDRSRNGLVPVDTDVWQQWVFLKLDAGGLSLADFLGADFMNSTSALDLAGMHWIARRTYMLDCNWKVFVDNYLDGGYHVNTVHPGLASVLDYSKYKSEIDGHASVQISPLSRGPEEIASVRRGDNAYYAWVFPNLMLNLYEGVMDTNLVLPEGPDACRVIFDFYFADPAGAERSMAVAHQVQLEDMGICEEVQRGLGSRAYDTGRFSVKREAGGYHFHQMLARWLRG